MKSLQFVRATLTAGCALFAFSTSPVQAAIDLFPAGTVWHPGTDGAFSPTANRVVDLSQAVTGKWDDDNTANAGKGIYDPDKWAVVFKYSSVNIPSGVTVSFTNHPSGAPVVWLVSGNVSIVGTVKLDGAAGTTDGQVSAPGPGGYRGGAGPIAASSRSAGFGPGGGRFDDNTGDGGSYGGPAGYSTVNLYGNAQTLPLIGGSGGGGSIGSYSGGGGAGGGAIVIAARDTVTLNGSVTSNGGRNTNYDNGGGSGGAVRIIADSFRGTTAGSINALGGTAQYRVGGVGRIRIEANNRTYVGASNPAASIAVPATPPTIWPKETHPSLKVLSIGGVTAPADPRSNIDYPQQDLLLASTSAMTIRLEARNVPANWLIKVRIVPRTGAETTVNATKVSGDTTLSYWEASISLANGLSFIQARASKS